MDRKIFKSTHFCNRINVFQKLYSAGDHYSLLLVGMILCSIIIWSSYSKGLWAENATQGNNKESEGRIMGKYSAFNSYILHVVAELQCVKRLPEEVGFGGSWMRRKGALPMHIEMRSNSTFKGAATECYANILSKRQKIMFYTLCSVF